MIRAYSVFIEEDLGSRTRLIGWMVDKVDGGWSTSAIIPRILVFCMAAALTDVTVHLSK